MNLSMFKNENKTKENQPDYYLTRFNEQTKQYEQYGAGWIKQTKAGKSFVSLKVEPRKS